MIYRQTKHWPLKKISSSSWRLSHLFVLLEAGEAAVMRTVLAGVDLSLNLLAGEWAVVS
jgi:hypothetical protein